MRRFALLVVIVLPLLAPAGQARSEEPEGEGARLQELLDLVSELHEQVADLTDRVAALENVPASTPGRPTPRLQPEAGKDATARGVGSMPRGGAPDDSGTVALPVSVRAIPAYTRVARDDVLDPNGQLAVIRLKRELVENTGILTDRDLEKIVGRVLKYAKPAGYAFRESEFYPEGTRPGPIAGVPPGKRGTRVRVADIPDLAGLAQFDRFDLVMTVRVALSAAPGESRAGDEPSQTGQEPTAGDPSPRRVRYEVRTIVQDGLVVLPASARDGRSDHGGIVEDDEIVIAVDPEEFPALSFALAAHVPLQTAMRSGQSPAGGLEDGRIPDVDVEILEDEPDDVPPHRGDGGAEPEGDR